MGNLNENFQKLTGINVLDIEKILQEANESSDANAKKAAFSKLQWLVPQGQYTDTYWLEKYGISEEDMPEKMKLYGEVLKELASTFGVENSEDLDINDNGTSTDTEDKQVQQSLSEAYAIVGYDSEDDSDDTSSN